MLRHVPSTRRRLLILAASMSLGVPGFTLASGISTADSVVSYIPGDFSLSGTSTSFQNSSAALGPINGNTGFGGLTPFNGPFSTSHIVGVGAGGWLTLHLNNPVPATGRTLGVFSNNTLFDVSSDGSGQADNPAATISTPPQAIVSVSENGIVYRTLNGGAPITFDNPTNAYLDQPIVSYFQTPGSVAAAQQKPFLGSLASFNGKNYAQMKTTLNGSAGGTWLDTSGVSLPAINYVKFEVPNNGTTRRLILDSVAGMTAAQPIVEHQPVIFESVGTGANTSHVVLDFGPQSFEFAVHYDSSISGIQALQLIEDNSLFRFGTQTFSFGQLVTEQDYGGFDIAGAGNNGNDFWSYYVGDGSSWSLSGQGASARLLSNGSFDGWVWNAAQATPPDRPVAAPEPAAIGLMAVWGLMLVRRRRVRR